MMKQQSITYQEWLELTPQQAFERKVPHYAIQSVYVDNPDDVSGFQAISYTPWSYLNQTEPNQFNVSVNCVPVPATGECSCSDYGGRRLFIFKTLVDAQKQVEYLKEHHPCYNWYYRLTRTGHQLIKRRPKD